MSIHMSFEDYERTKRYSTTENDDQQRLVTRRFFRGLCEQADSDYEEETCNLRFAEMLKQQRVANHPRCPLSNKEQADRDLSHSTCHSAATTIEVRMLNRATPLSPR